MLLTCRLYLIGCILFWLHSLFLRFYRTVVCLSCITVYICWRWPYSYFVSYSTALIWVFPQCTLIFFYQSFMSIHSTWLAIWFSAEFGYSSPLCGRCLATLLACIAGVRKGRERELGGRRGTPARKPLFSPSRLLIKKITKITQLWMTSCQISLVAMHVF